VKDKHRAAPYLNKDQHIIEWSVDINDIDKVLRVVIQEGCPSEIVSLINDAGYQCEELTD
jgi:hypothetical protein